MAALTIQAPGLVEVNTGAGNTPDVGGDTVDNTTGRVMLRCTNSDGSARTVTVAAQKSNPDTSTSYNDIEITVPATTGDVICGPFDRTIYNQTDKSLALTYDAITGLKVWVFQI